MDCAPGTPSCQTGKKSFVKKNHEGEGGSETSEPYSSCWCGEQHETNPLKGGQHQNTGKHCEVIGIQKLLEAMAVLTLSSKHS